MIEVENFINDRVSSGIVVCFVFYEIANALTVLIPVEELTQFVVEDIFYDLALHTQHHYLAVSRIGFLLQFQDT